MNNPERGFTVKIVRRDFRPDNEVQDATLFNGMGGACANDRPQDQTGPDSERERKFRIDVSH
jgi:hypothetical protein